jgi:hypothetical protein
MVVHTVICKSCSLGSTTVHPKKRAPILARQFEMRLFERKRETKSKKIILYHTSQQQNLFVNMEKVQKRRLSLCPSLIPSGSTCGKGLLTHKKEDGKDNIETAFRLGNHKNPTMTEIKTHVKDTISNLDLEPSKDNANSCDTSKAELKVCSPFILSLFVALAPLNGGVLKSWGFTPCQPQVHSRLGLLSEDLLTPMTNNITTYIEHMAAGGDEEGGVFSKPIETMLYSMDPNGGAPIYPMEILESTQYRKAAIGGAKNILLDHLEDAFKLLVDDAGRLTDYLPVNLHDKMDEPVIWFLALVAGIQKKYNGLGSNQDWLSMLSSLSKHKDPEAYLSISSVADLHFTTRVAFAEKVLCKIAITKGLRKTLLTYHISHHELPPETLEQILNPSHLKVVESTIFSDPCPIRVTATKGTEAAFEKRLGEERAKQMKEAWDQTQEHRPSTVQDFLLECITDMCSKGKEVDFLTSAKELCDGLGKKDQVNLHRMMRDRAATLVLKVHAGQRNIHLTQIVEQYRINWDKTNTAEPETGSEPGDWRQTLVESLCTGKNTLKMTSAREFRWKGGSTLNLLLAILTQSVFLVETTDGGQRLENDELLFQIIRQNGRGKHHHVENKIVSPPSSISSATT